MSLKLKVWLGTFPVVVLFTAAFFIHEWGTQGALRNPFLHSQIYPALRRLSAITSDFKFRMRGVIERKNPIVIVEVDNEDLAKIGRWPWRRDEVAWLIEKCFQLGARLVGVDILFTEPEKRVPDELASHLKQRGLFQLVEAEETDPKLKAVVRKYADRLVLTWAAQQCHPLYESRESCPVIPSSDQQAFPENFERFGFWHVQKSRSFDPRQTPVVSAARVDGNIASFLGVTKHQGFANTFRDPDGNVRKTALTMLVGGHPHPSFALELAQLYLGERLKIDLGADSRIERMYFTASGKELAITKTGAALINYRGPQRKTFPHVPASDVLTWDETPNAERSLASEGLKLMKGSIVLIGVSALALSDFVPTPFDSTMPGVEVQATILDNLLTQDFLRTGVNRSGFFLFSAAMVVAGVGFSFAALTLSAIWALLIFVTLFVLLFVADFALLFPSNQDWATVFFYLEMVALLIVTLCARYVIEERDKKFLRSAFSKYVSPAVVDLIVRDRSKLSVWGKRKEVTILFCDIRGFTHMCENMDARAVGELLNDYFGMMTEIVFKTGGTLDKYIGDALMAFWGAPIDEPRHAYLACKAANTMVEVFTKNSGRLENQFGQKFKVGIGLNSGIATVGNMGSTKNFSYTAIGDEVNLASRMESATKHYGVSPLCSETTIRLMDKVKESPIVYLELDLARLRGKEKPVLVFQLLNPHAPSEGINEFQKARALYKSRQWREASESFRRAGALLNGNGVNTPSELLAARCDRFFENPPLANWDGAWTLDEGGPTQS